MIKFKDGRLMREMIEIDSERGKPIPTDEVLDENIRKGFGSEDYLLLEDQRRIIYIHTMIQDCKKFGCDVRRKWEKQEATLFYINSETDLVSLWGRRGVLYFAQKVGFLKNAFLDIILQIIGTLSLLSSVFAFISPFLQDRQSFFLSPYLTSIICIIAGCLILFWARALRERQLDDACNSMNEAKINDFTNLLPNMKMGKLRFSEQNILIIENINKLEEHVNAFLLYYLMKPTNGNQIWCILDDGTNEFSIKNAHINGYIEEYYLCPVSMEDKKEIIYQLGLRDYKEELLGSLGIDSLFWEELGHVEEYEYSDRLAEKVNVLVCSEKNGKNYLGAVYCLAYLMVKLGYFMSLKNMVQLVCSEHDNKRYFKKLEEQCKKDIGAHTLQMSQFQEFLRKLIELLGHYCIVNNKKEIRFSTNFFKCLETHFGVMLPSQNTTLKWVLIKLICNQDRFNEENYFLDCCNLLQQVEFEDIAADVQVSLRLVDALNKNGCWLYYPMILNRLDDLTQNTKEREKYLQSEAVKRAVINYRILIADDMSIQFHKNYITEYCGLNQEQCNQEQCSTEQIPASRLGFLNLVSEDNLAFYQNMMCLNDPTAYYYYLMGQWLQIETSIFPKLETRPCLDISWDYPVSEPAAVIIDLLKILITFISGQKSEILPSLHRELNEITEFLHSKKYYSSHIMEKIVYEFNHYFDVGKSDHEIRLLFLGTSIENTNSMSFRFLFNMYKNIFEREIDDYKFQSAELNFAYGFIYYKYNAYEKGITDYIHYVINSNFSTVDRIRILLFLLTRGVPRPDDIIHFCIVHKNGLIQELCSWIDYAADMKTLESVLVQIYILASNLETDQFWKEITDGVENALTMRSDLEYPSIINIFRYIMLDKNIEDNLPEDDFIAMINKLSSREFALTFFAKYYEKNEDVITLLPKVDGLMASDFRTSIPFRLIGDYLIKCPIDEISMEILTYYKRIMRVIDSDNLLIINSYLEVIDKYGKIMKIKETEKDRYCYYQSKLIYIELSILRENVVNTFTERQLLVFTYRLIQLLHKEVQIADKHESVSINFSERTDEIDNYVFEHIKDTKAVISRGAFYLNKPYVDMVYYLAKYPESYAMLINRMGQKHVEIILNSNLIQLLGIYIDLLDDQQMLAAINYLQEARAVLKNYDQILRGI